MHPRVGQLRGGYRARLALTLLVLLACACSLDSAHAVQSSPRTSAIVFERGGDLYAIAADGSRRVRVTRTRKGEFDPATSPDGSRIAFSRGGGGISTMRPDGSHRKVVTIGSDGTPAWGPHGLTIYFVRTRHTRFGDCGSIYEVSLGARKHFRRVTNSAPSGHNHVEPAVSPDGRRIAFTDWDACEGGTSSPRLQVVDIYGRQTGDLARLPHNGYYPDPEHSSADWSPDGRRLAFLRNGSLAIANRDGSHEHLVAPVATSLIYQRPSWSPDGRWIAFLNGSRDDALLLVRAEGGGHHLIARHVSSLGGWLPDLPKRRLSER